MSAKDLKSLRDGLKKLKVSFSKSADEGELRGVYAVNRIPLPTSLEETHIREAALEKLEKALEKREAALDEREAKLVEREKLLRKE